MRTQPIPHLTTDNKLNLLISQHSNIGRFFPRIRRTRMSFSMMHCSLFLFQNAVYTLKSYATHSYDPNLEFSVDIFFRIFRYLIHSHTRTRFCF